MLAATSDLSYCMRCRKWRPFGKDMPSGLLRVSDTKQNSAEWFWLRVETPFHCHREKQQGFTSLYAAVSHSVNEVGKHIYKWWLVRWFYRTQADACGSRAIEWFIQLAHRCWPPLPTYRIACDAGSDDLSGKYVPFGLLRVSDTKQNSTDRLWLQVETPVHATERSSRVSLRSTQLFLTVSIRSGS